MSLAVTSPPGDFPAEVSGGGVVGLVTETALLMGVAGVVGVEQEGEQQHHTQLDRRNSSDQQEGQEQQHWNRLGMLLLVSTLAALGTLGNIFAIAAVMTEEHLKKKGKCMTVPLCLGIPVYCVPGRTELTHVSRPLERLPITSTTPTSTFHCPSQLLKQTRSEFLTALKLALMLVKSH